MAKRIRLLEISELNIATRLIHMDTYQLNEYTEALNMFVEGFPAQEAASKQALEAKDYLSLSKCLVAIRDMLISIHADQLADECLKQINGLTAVKHEKTEAYMTYLLSVLTMLSIDIQMAIYEGDNEEEDMPIAESWDEPEVEKRSILAVDDDPFLLETLKRTFQDTAYKLTGVNSGVAALRFLQKHSADLFILDIDMPEMNGYELAQKIRAYGKKSPIIFLTGNATQEYVVNAIKAGAADFITKPVIQKQVLERVAKFI